MQFPLPRAFVDQLVKAALAEDLGDAGDITSLACIPATTKTTARLCARKQGVISGSEFALSAFAQMDTDIHVAQHIADGENVKPGDVVLEISGPARAVLAGERVALNFIGHMSGIASATRSFVDAVVGSKAKITCTRKTLPTLRSIQKYAVRCGGGFNHRFGLYDAVMIKDNHIAAAGDMIRALEKVRATHGHMVKIEIEVDDLAQLHKLLAEKKYRPDVVLLDNMSLEDLRRAVGLNAGAFVLEASGNVTLETVRAIAETGVDVISSGWLTHSAPNLDLGLDF
jgi:nicotinate-nucleotide pyrophosphorylase (carboxylating)